MDYVYPKFVEYYPIVAILLFVHLGSAVHRQYISVYIYGLVACQISCGSLLVAVGPRDQESFRMALILLG
jgi:hypothetical protein